MTQIYLLSIEIRTIEPSLNNRDPDSVVTIFCDSQDNCFIGSSLEQVKTAILGAIPHLGTNFRHPLFFNVQILPGNQTDALIASIEHQKTKRTGRRFRQTRIN
jgi:hypothetical protein